MWSAIIPREPWNGVWGRDKPKRLPVPIFGAVSPTEREVVIVLLAVQNWNKISTLLIDSDVSIVDFVTLYEIVCIIFVDN